MPFKDKKAGREKDNNRKRAWRARIHAKRYGVDAGDQRGKSVSEKRRGPAHYRWNHGVIISSSGYEKVRIGKGHPWADPNGYAYRHKVVWLSDGREIPPGCVIHHLNGNKLDNRLENLELLPRGRHNAHHNELRTRDALGRFERAAGRTLDGVLHDEYPAPTDRAQLPALERMDAEDDNV